MAFRTVVIKNRCKLEYSMNYLICRKQDEEVRILLDEIKTLVIDSLQVSITSYLIFELADKNIKIIFVDDKHNPIGEVIPYQANAYNYRHIKEQIAFSDTSKDYLWQLIIKEKINNQSKVLRSKDLLQASLKLEEYYNSVEYGDITNREGHAAKVYFNALFGKDFSRDQDCIINKYLNYGYSIILSLINREIVIHGYLPEIGIHHIGESNPFNLACDFMEPLRQLIDYMVSFELINEDNYIDMFVAVLQKVVRYQGKEIILENAIHLYVEDLINFLNTGDIERIRFIDYGI